MANSIIGITKAYDRIDAAVDALRTRGIDLSNISVVLPDTGQGPGIGVTKESKAPEGTTAGVLTGGVIGGTLGLLAGIGALAIPGLGPFIAAGPIMATLSGAAAGATAGGVTGVLIGMGIPELEAKAYERHLKEGGYLLVVHGSENTDEGAVKDVPRQYDFEEVASVDQK